MLSAVIEVLGITMAEPVNAIMAGMSKLISVTQCAIKASVISALPMSISIKPKRVLRRAFHRVLSLELMMPPMNSPSDGMMARLPNKLAER